MIVRSPPSVYVSVSAGAGGVCQILLLFLVLAATGCARPVPPSPLATETPAEAAEARAMLRAGFNQVITRYVEPVSPERIARAALARIVAIDPTIDVAREDERIVLNRDGLRVAAARAPDGGDIDGWAELVQHLWFAARPASPAIARLSLAQGYDAAFAGAVTMLDRYSQYDVPAEARENRRKRSGYEGVGIQFRREESVVRITDVVEEGPAYQAGIRSGMILTEIDGDAVSEMSEADISAALRGFTGSRVTLEVRRDDQARPTRYLLTRSYILPETVFVTVDDGIVEMSVTGFNDGTASRLAKKLGMAVRRNPRQLRGGILDLRGNRGGILSQAVKVADLFLRDGEIVTTLGRHPDSIHVYKAGGRDLLGGRPLVVLIDGGSASASEVIAAALKDRRRAVLIGTSSFGKGVVQTIITLPNDGELLLTWSYAVSPAGTRLQDKGVAPILCTSGLNTPDASFSQLRRTPARAKAGTPDATSPATPSATPPDPATICPPERRIGALEDRIARRILADYGLYSRFLREETGNIVRRGQTPPNPAPKTTLQPPAAPAPTFPAPPSPILAPSSFN